MKLLVLIFLLCSTSVYAESRKVDFSIVLKDLDDKPFQWDCEEFNDDKSICKKWRDMTLRLISVTAIIRQWPNENMPDVDQVRRALLAQEIYKKNEVALDAKDTDLICVSIAKLVTKGGLNSLVTLRAWEILDPARVEKLNAK